MFVEVCKNNIEEYTYEFMGSIASAAKTTKKDEISNVFVEYSDSEVDFPELTDEQYGLVVDDLSSIDTNFSIKKINVSEDRKSATIVLVLDNVFIPDGDKLYTGDKEAIQKQIRKSRQDETEVTLELVRDDTKWIFDDLSELVDIIFLPYEKVYFIGPDGLPINITDEFIQQYADESFIECIWYDPIMGSPLDDYEMKPTQYLECVFYFNKPQKLEVEAVLKNDGEEVMRIKMPISNSVVATCDYGYDLKSKTFDAGDYIVELYVRDYLLATSPVIKVK